MTLTRSPEVPTSLTRDRDRDAEACHSVPLPLPANGTGTGGEGTHGDGEGEPQWAGTSNSLLVMPQNGHTSVTVLRCRACDGTGTAEKPVSLVVTTGRVVEVVTTPRREDDLMGFRAALMDLEDDLKESNMFEMARKNSCKA
jgi:hypothetical protein